MSSREEVFDRIETCTDEICAAIVRRQEALNGLEMHMEGHDDNQMFGRLQGEQWAMGRLVDGLSA